ncbi:hypothetical protein GCM10011512_21170 [Tersicoccus solisilvae]|uniref:DUF3592 domain-containing protein n=1 Tax=Tersicoccus solisilvae TaxID=1882339 RepID=A0ABQ1PAG1_9MICC|nr:DUF3592 domain-containing protein [Tersicoccus solisilvae]GGC93903.1 hypothetical protein GCM10011512_21170 [Tersicoccus solisilvae]
MIVVLAAVLLVLVGGSSVVLGLRVRRRCARRLREWTAVEATVVGRSPGAGADVSQEGLVAQYRWHDGRVRTVRSAVSRTSVPWRSHQGETITVHVDPADPDEAAIVVGPWGEQRAVGLTVAIGIVFVVVGLVVGVVALSLR